MKKNKPPLVLSIHGIRTFANWQHKLSDELFNEKIPHEPFNYGYYPLGLFLFPPSNLKMIDKFYCFYSSMVEKYKLDLNQIEKRPSIVVHSFGSFILGYAMLKHPDIKFNKVIICGSILPQDFDLRTIFYKDQVDLIRNEYGCNDFWSKIVKYFVPLTGNSGAFGFDLELKQLEQEPYNVLYGHSSFSLGKHMKDYWIPFLYKDTCPYKIVNGKDIKEENEFMSIAEINSEEIDKYHFGQLPFYPEIELPDGLSLTWIRVNPDIYTFLLERNTKKYCGYINAMPVSDSAFDAIISGKQTDENITDEDIELFAKGSRIRIYFMSIALHPNVLKSNIGLINLPFEKLFNGFIGKLIDYYKNKNIVVTDFLAIAMTSHGKKMCRLLGMKVVNKDKFGNPIYHLDTSKVDLNDLKRQKALFQGVYALLSLYKSGKEKN